MRKTTALILAATCLGAGTAVAGDKELFEGKCAMCHPLSRALDQTKNRDGWTATVTRMQKVNGCPVTDEEAKAIVEYLVKVRGPATSEKK